VLTILKSLCPRGPRVTLISLTGHYRCTAKHPKVERVYRRVIGLRCRNPWLVDAMIETEQVDKAHLVVQAKARHGS